MSSIYLVESLNNAMTDIEEVTAFLNDIEEAFNSRHKRVDLDDVIDYIKEGIDYRQVFEKFSDYFKGQYPSPEQLESLLHKAFEKNEPKKEKYNLTGRYINTSEMFYTQNVVGTLDDACRVMVEAIRNELGDGDGENGGKGSLPNCYGDIWDALKKSDDHVYDYGNCHFYITKL